MARPARPRQSRRSGFIIVYMSVALVALMAMASLAFDWGRVQTATQELQNAADAAARAAAAGLSDGTSVTKAQLEASYNSADGTSVTLLSSDVETGTWNLSATPPAFVPGGTPTNAVRVTACRVAARGTAVPLVFGRVIGINTRDVVAKAVCRQSSLCAVGVNSLSITGNGIVRRTGTEGGGVTAASNGTYTFGTSSNAINGDTFYRTTAPTGTVSGKKAALPYDFVYAAPVTPGGATVYGPVSVSSGTQYVSGNISVTTCTVNGTTNVYLVGDTNIYASDVVYIGQSVTVTTNGYKLRVFETGTASVTIANSNPVTLSVYAPASNVSFSGPGTLTGSLVGRTLSITAPLEFTAGHYVPAAATGGDLNMTVGGVQTMK